VIGAVVTALEGGADGAMPMLAASDTLRRAWHGWKLDAGGHVTISIAPDAQGFVYDRILKAHRDHAAREATDDAAWRNWAGMTVTMVEGEEKNLKVTRKEDFALAEALLGGGDVRTGQRL